MKKFQNVLSASTVDKIYEELALLKNQDVWNVSDLFWDERLNVGVTGICTATLISDLLSKEIHEQIYHLLPPHNRLVLQHYIWHKHSGISAHGDPDFKFGATIYLNQNWDINYGGIFVWEDLNTKELHASCPEFNTMIVNTDKETHLVTPVSPLAPENRFTIQIWGF